MVGNPPGVSTPPRPRRKSIEQVNHPAHYGGADNPYEVIKVLRAWLTPEEYIGFCKGNAIKYLARAKKKDSEDENYNKGNWYLSELCAFSKERSRDGREK